MGIQEFLAEQKKEREENTKELFKETVGDTWKMWGSYKKERERMYEDRLDTTIERQNITDYLVQQYENEVGAMTEAQEVLYRQYMENRLENDPSMVDWHKEDSVSEYVKQDMADTLTVLEKFGEAISKEDTLSNQLLNFNETWNSASVQDKSFLEDYYSELFYLQKELGEDTVKILDDLGITSTAQIQEGSTLYKDEFDTILDIISTRTKELIIEGKTAAEAASQAWSEVAMATEDSEQKQ